jgi:hypothetical protein
VQALALDELKDERWPVLQIKISNAIECIVRAKI